MVIRLQIRPGSPIRGCPLLLHAGCDPRRTHCRSFPAPTIPPKPAATSCFRARRHSCRPDHIAAPQVRRLQRLPPPGSAIFPGAIGSRDARTSPRNLPGSFGFPPPQPGDLQPKPGASLPLRSPTKSQRSLPKADWHGLCTHNPSGAHHNPISPVPSRPLRQESLE